jgi:hypothetical protein
LTTLEIGHTKFNTPAAENNYLGREVSNLIYPQLGKLLATDKDDVNCYWVFKAKKGQRSFAITQLTEFLISRGIGDFSFYDHETGSKLW